jgi:tetratricopeptide (TPR) repeat protein
VRLDPQYARAYSSLGRAYMELQNYGLMGTVEALAEARSAASHALDIVPQSSEALAVLGYADLMDGKLQTAGQLLERAIENGPSDAVALSYYAEYLWEDARPEESIAIYRKVIGMDPLNQSPYVSLASNFSNLQRFAEADATIARLREIAPKSPNARAFEALVEGDKGNLAAATRIMIDAYELDPDDADIPGMVGRFYLALDMPVEAGRWFDRAVEADARNPIARSAPLFLNYYLQQNDEENFRLARELLADNIDERRSSRFMALNVLVELAGKLGRNDVALEVLDNLYPNLFDDPPHDLEREPVATFFVGLALKQSGDVERGSLLLQSYINERSRYDDVYGVNRSSIGGRLAIGDVDGAKDRLPGFEKVRYYWELNRMLLERSHLYDALREEPAFVAMLENYRAEAAEQRTLLQAMTQ